MHNCHHLAGRDADGGIGVKYLCFTCFRNKVIPMINTQEVVFKGALTETLLNKLRQGLHAQLVCYLEGIPPYKLVSNG
jgi:hypothetical protein